MCSPRQIVNKKSKKKGLNSRGLPKMQRDYAALKGSDHWCLTRKIPICVFEDGKSRLTTYEERVNHERA